MPDKASLEGATSTWMKLSTVQKASKINLANPNLYNIPQEPPSSVKEPLSIYNKMISIENQFAASVAATILWNQLKSGAIPTRVFHTIRVISHKGINLR